MPLIINRQQPQPLHPHTHTPPPPLSVFISTLPSCCQIGVPQRRLIHVRPDLFSSRFRNNSEISFRVSQVEPAVFLSPTQYKCGGRGRKGKKKKKKKGLIERSLGIFMQLYYFPCCCSGEHFFHHNRCMSTFLSALQSVLLGKLRQWGGGMFGGNTGGWVGWGVLFSQLPPQQCFSGQSQVVVFTSARMSMSCQNQ